MKQWRLAGAIASAAGIATDFRKAKKNGAQAYAPRFHFRMQFDSVARAG
jgi:hypothetical protein